MRITRLPRPEVPAACLRREIICAVTGGGARLGGVTGPPAEGSRVDWAEVPAPVRAEVERACGARVAEAMTALGGFSPGLAARVACDDGRRWFVKAASGQANPDTPRLHRREAGILRGLDPLIRSGRLPAPRLRATARHGSWFALILDDIDGRRPALPWEDDQAGQVLDAIRQLAAVLTPAPVAAPPIGQYLGADFTGWRTLARAPGLTSGQRPNPPGPAIAYPR